MANAINLSKLDFKFTTEYGEVEVPEAINLSKLDFKCLDSDSLIA